MYRINNLDKKKKIKFIKYLFLRKSYINYKEYSNSINLKKIISDDKKNK